MPDAYTSTGKCTTLYTRSRVKGWMRRSFVFASICACGYYFPYVCGYVPVRREGNSRSLDCDWGEGAHKRWVVRAWLNGFYRAFSLFQCLHRDLHGLFDESWAIVSQARGIGEDRVCHRWICHPDKIGSFVVSSTGIN